MILSNDYCQVAGAVMQCIADMQHRCSARLPLVIEIGCADGLGTGRYAGFCSRVLCIDPMVSGRPDVDPNDTSVKDGVDEKKVEEFWENVRHSHHRVELLKACSSWPKAVATAEDWLDRDKADILIIDGAHHPSEAVLKDFDLYVPFVRKGGFVIFDDIYEPDVREAYESAISSGLVEEAWRYSSTKHPQYSKFLQSIGVLRVL